MSFELVDIAKVVRVNGVVFTSEALEGLVNLADQNAEIRVMRFGDTIYFKRLVGQLSPFSTESILESVNAD